MTYLGTIRFSGDRKLVCRASRILSNCGDSDVYIHCRFGRYKVHPGGAFMTVPGESVRLRCNEVGQLMVISRRQS